MNQAHNLVGSVGQTYAKGNNNPSYLSNIAFMSKAELRKTIELMQMEIDRLMVNRIKDLESIDKKNTKILEQQDEIIGLYSKLNEVSPLKIKA